VKKRNYFTNIWRQGRAILEALLNKYADEDIGALESAKYSNTGRSTKIGTPLEIINEVFGGKDEYEKATTEFGAADVWFGT